MYSHSNTVITYSVQYQLWTLLVALQQQYEETIITPSPNTHNFIDTEIKILRV